MTGEISLKVYNNLGRKKELFHPIENGKVRFYSCGPTTYDFLHVGNAYALITGDLMFRVMKVLGFEVTFVRNFTDVDDKIIERASELGTDPLKHSAHFVSECIQDMKSLGMMTPSYSPRVSETMPEIIQMISDLIKNDSAYVVDGEVFFNVPKFKDYGKLSKKDLKSLEHGIRVEVDKKKLHPADFVLWKPAKKGEISWPSPWGEGRPGWHIECSAMAKKFLGKSIDLHHGGVDLMFPHHENEIAQSEAANGVSFSTHWCHNEFLNFGHEKMSKSLGNVITIRKFVETYGGEVLRQLLLSVHYRSKLDWSEENIAKAISDVERITQFIVEIKEEKKIASKDIATERRNSFLNQIRSVIVSMKEELANDFNAPGALSHLFALIREVRNIRTQQKLSLEEISAIEEVLEFCNQALGVTHQNPQELLQRLNLARGKLHSGQSQIEESEILKLLEERKEARINKNWNRSDEIRDELKAKKVILKDNPDGTTSWFYE